MQNNVYTRHLRAWMLVDLVLLLTQVSGTSTVETDADPIVNTASGSIRGVRLTDPQVDAFLGIPFAQPPVGRLRFRLPEPVETWDGILNASRFANACYQMLYQSDFSGDAMWNPRTNLSEDCLYLNVWLPVPRRSGTPVMVWIHGGGFTGGSTSRDMFKGAKNLAVEGNVIVVTLAYRLGPLGFLYLDHESAPGNQGLYDQNMALRWVQANIESFGGDPNSVTLFGCSAGAYSIVLHLLSPLSQGLFHRAIVESMPRDLSLGDTADTRNYSFSYAIDTLQCPDTRDAQSLSDCLRGKDPGLLTAKQYVSSSGVSPFHPVVDKKFLPSSPQELLSSGRMKRCPVLIGTVRNEGSYFVLYSVPEYLNRTHKTMTRKQFVSSMEKIFHRLPTSRDNQQALRELIDLYTPKDNPNSTDRNLEALDAAFTDLYFLCPALEIAEDYEGVGQDVYVYRLTYRYERNPWPAWMGVTHGDEMFFVFGSAPAPGLDLTEAEIPLSRAMVTYWTNFVKTGTPNSPSTNGTSGVWPTYRNISGWKSLDLNLRHFNSSNQNSSSVREGIGIEECAALNRILLPDQREINGGMANTETVVWVLVTSFFVTSILHS